jgi:hypothetical protein
MDPVTAVVIALLGGGGVGAWVAFKKAGPEIELTSVTTLNAVIATLRVELERRDEEIAALRERLAVLESKVG